MAFMLKINGTPHEVDVDLSRWMSALPPKADIERRDWHVCFVPKADKRAAAKVPLFDHRVGTGEQLPKRMLSEFAVVP